jgi:rod shape-determining protein MreD
MRRQKLLIALKHAGYMLLLLFVYVLQVTPGLFSLFGVKPMPVIALAVCIAMAEGEFAGGLYGVFCGLLLDFGAFTLFGIISVLMLICGVATGLLTIYLVRDGLRSAFLLTLAAARWWVLPVIFFSTVCGTLRAPSGFFSTERFR